jgi:uncharacterized protein
MTNSVVRDILQKFLLSDATPRDSMCISELDGFLNGIAAGPSAIPIEEWSALIWGSGTPSYRSVEQQKLILDLLSRRYADISNSLNDTSEETAPVDAEGNETILMASAWANGFLQAVEIRFEAWRPIFQHRTSSMFLLPLVNLYRDSEEDYDLPFSSDLNRAMVSVAVALLPTCARATRQFWKNWEDAQTTPLLKHVDGTRPEHHSGHVVIRPLEADVLKAKANCSITSPPANVQPKTRHDAVNMFGRPPAGITRSRSKRITPQEETIVGGEAPILDDRAILSAPRDAPEGVGELEQPQAMMITDRSGLILLVNDVFTSITGYPSEEVVGRTPRILKSFLTSSEEHASFWRELLSKGRWRGLVWNRSRSGEPFRIVQTVNLVKDANDELFGYISVFRRVDRCHVIAVETQPLAPLRS